MRRNSFLSQVLTAVARATPTADPVRDSTTDSQTGRPASQLLTAIARATPAFTPGRTPALTTRLSTPQQPERAASMPHAVGGGGGGGGGAEDLLEFAPRGPSVRRPRLYRQALIVALTAFAVPVIIASIAFLKTTIHRSSGPAPINGSSDSQTPTSTATRTHSLSPSNSATPTVGNLPLAQLQVGDCLTGANLELDKTTSWPKLSEAVPCSQGHTAEVFYANSNFWGKGGSYPGDGAIKNAATTRCNSAFQSYVGIAYSKSIYTWTDVVPDASTWPGGDRSLRCVVYYATPNQPGGAVIHGSLKGASK